MNKLNAADTTHIARLLSQELSAFEKNDVLSFLTGHVMDQSNGDESARIEWLKNVFCEVPLLDAGLDADKACRLFTFLLHDLYPDIKGYFSQELRIPFLMGVELVIRQLRELLSENSQQSNKLYRLQAITLSRLGAELTYTSDHDFAMQKLLSAVEIMQRLVAEEPSNKSFQRTLSNIFSNLGILEKDVSSETAHTWFEKSAAIRKLLLESEPENPFYMELLATSYCLLGDVAEHIESDAHFEGSIEYFLKNYRLCRQAVKIKLEDENYQYALSIACERLGCLRLQHDKPEKALRWFKKSYSVTERHYEANRDSRPKIDTYWVTCNLLGRTYSALGNVASAHDWLFKALEVAERLYSCDHNNIRYCGILAMACLNLAEELEGRHHETALKYFSRSLELTEARIRNGLRSIDYCKMAIAAHEGFERTNGEYASEASPNNRLAELKTLLDQISC